MIGRCIAIRASFNTSGHLIALCAACVCLSTRGVMGQTARSYAGDVSAVDKYGNARYVYRSFRSVRTFGNEPVRPVGRPVSSPAAAVPRQGVLTALPRPTEMYRLMQSRRASYPSPGGSVPHTLRQAYARYGGFARRPVYGQAGDMRVVLQRRRELLQATSLNAPVHRARVMYGTGDIGLPTAVASTAFADTEPPGSSVELAKLGERLEANAAKSHAEARARAWRWFKQGHEDVGNYRRAAHAFKAAVTLNPTDFEARIGELFSRLSIGSFRESIVLLANMVRRDPAPFSHRLDFTELYTDRIHARQVYMQCETYVRLTGGDPGAQALHAFVLWYSGRREEAIAAAEALAASPGGKRFSDWAAQMQAVVHPDDADGGPT
ncbi:MAG: hypothetical protein ACE5HE_06825 [Phycisphaerae bacterium]